MIHRSFTLAGIFISSLISGNSGSKTEIIASQTCTTETKSFQSGESLTYKVYYNAGPVWLSGGEVYFKLNEEDKDGKLMYHAVSAATSYKSFDWFFKVRDKMESWMDPNSLQSTTSFRDVYEGGYTFYRSYDWNRNTNTITSFLDRHKGTTKTVILTNVDPCAVDLLSSFYWARSIDFTKYNTGDKIPVVVAIDDKIYNLYIRYDGKEKYKTKLGTFNCLKLKPLLVEGQVFRAGEGMTIWVTDDSNRIPVRIESELRIGRITADLKSYAGTKYPFTSKVE